MILVPGYGGSTGSLAALAPELTAAGRDADVVALPGDARGDLTEAAAALGRAVDAAKERTGSATVDVVGYSAGGVIAGLWLAAGGADSGPAACCAACGASETGGASPAGGSPQSGAAPIATAAAESVVGSAPESASMSRADPGAARTAGPLRARPRPR